MDGRFAVVKNGVLVVALHGEYLLKIQLTYHPFTEDDIPQKVSFLFSVLPMSVFLVIETKHRQKNLVIDGYNRIFLLSVLILVSVKPRLQCTELTDDRQDQRTN